MESLASPGALVCALLAAPWLLTCAAQVASSGRPPALFAGVAGPLVIAHRGGSLEAPENTVAAVRHGVESGADWQEIDVTLTADDHVVVIHDDTLERTTGAKGRVEQAVLAQLRALSAGRPRWGEDGAARLALFGVTPPDFGERYAGERVPTLDEILAVKDARLMIELKKSDRGKELVEAVIAGIYRNGAADRVALGSFERSLLDAANRRDPSLPLIGIAEDEDGIEDMLELPVSVLAVRFDLIEDAREQAPPGVAVWTWTAYSVEMAEAAVARGAHGVITDVPAAVVKAFRPQVVVRE